MFGSNSPEKLVKKGKWLAIDNLLKKKNDSVILEIAQACAESNTDEAYNVLVGLIETENRAVKLAVVKGLGKAGRDSASTHLLHLMNESKDDEELQNTIKSALTELKDHRIR